jgi:peptide/nickel transport system permease protein
VLEVLGEEYMRTARAKGLPERIVLIRHGLRNALIPIVTVVGLQFSSLLGGAVLTETVFARQGVGSLIVDAINFKDFPLVQGTVFLAALAYMVVNLIVDLLYGFLDPRIQY